MQALAQHVERSRPLQAFFKQVGGSKPCEACGCPDWYFYPGNPLFTLYPVEPEQYNSPQFLVICCNNCGNTRMFNWDRVTHFIEKEYKEGEDA